MRARFLWVISLVLAGCSPAVAAPRVLAPTAVAPSPQPAPPAANPNIWVPVVDRESGFVLQFPGTPTARNEQVQDQDPISRKTTYTFSRPNFWVSMSVLQFRQERDPFAAADQLETQLIHESGAEVMSHQSQDSTVGGYLVRELRVQKQNEVLLGRIFEGRRHSFVVTAIVPRAHENNLAPVLHHIFASAAAPASDSPALGGDGVIGIPATWNYVIPAGADFAVKLPAQPNVRRVAADVDQHAYPQTTFLTKMPDDSASYGVTEITFNNAMPVDAIDLVAHAIETSPRQPLIERSQHAIQVRGYAGREFAFDSTDGTHVVAMRFYVTATRVYMVWANYVKAVAESHANDTRTLFDSFRIL